MTTTLNILGISGSLRRQSRNTGLLRAAQKVAPADMRFTIAEIANVPFYNADVAAQDKPPAAARIIGQIAAADALVLACPEYNYSMAPALKNVLDWASREPGNSALNGKAVAIFGAAGGMGSSRAQYHLRQSCVFLNLHPLNRPEVFANAFGDSFDADGNLTDPKIIQLITDQMQALVAWTRRLKA
ncbi:MAG: NAD(P)H-dependent oxidoreductase [Gammaproteobacteria bacterium]|nr:NAD(P)H-dependent oxidoreductase [Gammaproteobacteria bacterium]